MQKHHPPKKYLNLCLNIQVALHELQSLIQLTELVFIH